YRDREVRHCCAQAGATVLLTPAEFRGWDFGAMGRRMADEVPGLVPVVVGPDDFPRAEGHALPPAVPPPAAGATRWICYTSGTTSAPKGARHGDAALDAVAAAMAERLAVESTDRYAGVFPFPHIGGILLLFMALQSGCVLLLDETFDPVTTVDFLAREEATHAGAGTSFHLAYLAAQRTRPNERLLPALKCCPGGGAPKPPTIHEEVQRELGGAGVVSGWGLTEAPILTMGAVGDPDDELAVSEGRPMPGVRIRVSDAGELQAKAPQVMLG